MEFKGAIFDMDGVITETAKVHAKAWKEMFDKFLDEYYSSKKQPLIPFDEAKDYLNYVDGKPRLKGVKDFLKSRKIEIPEGNPKDNINKKSHWGLANNKNQIFRKKIKEQKPKVYDSSIRLVKKLKKKGIKVAIISSSKNCKLILKICGIKNLFKHIIDGKISKKVGLSGKPDPDIFIYASKKLKLSPEECIIFEDSIAGIEAGINGNFGMVIGISRKNNKLKKADIVVKDLKEISIKKIKEWFKKGIQKDSWELKYYGYIPEQEKLRETLCTVGNGYLGTRGCIELQKESEFNYPGCYIAGIYNPLITKLKGKKFRINSMINCPNWVLIQLKIGDSKFIDFSKVEILDYEKILNLKEATLHHKFLIKDDKGRITEINSKRFASMQNPHICAIKLKVKPINYSDKIILYSCIDGNVENNNVKRYSNFKSKHLKTISNKITKNMMLLHTKTINSGYEIAISAKNLITKNMKKKEFKEKNLIGEKLIFKAKKGESYSIEKIVSIYTSRESKKVTKDSLSLLKNIKKFSDILKDHKRAWNENWKKTNIFLEGDRFSQKVLHSHIYHIISTYSPNVKGLDVGIPARGLHGEAYRGHIFWDELYILSFYIHHFPEIAKEALLYRYRRLPMAKKYAKEKGYKGAMYPWQSADTGEEETQEIHYNPKDNSLGPDYSQNQRHVSIAIFYNFYKYINHTKDIKFLYNKGALVMTEIARFWASIAKYNKKTKKYHINKVMGPDEFHEKYPWKKEAGLDDNAYTNVMTSWLLKKTLEIVEKLPKKTKEKLNIKKEEIETWKKISENLNIVIKNGIIMQFKDYDKLKEINWEHYRKKYGNIERIDRILKAEGKSPDNYKVLKQADVLMIFYLLEFNEAIKILKKLGVKINNPKDFIKKNYNYYITRTTHGSTLSRFVHNAIVTKLKHKKEFIWEWFEMALKTDIYDTQKGTTSEGIHCGLMTGTINILRKYFAGIKTHKKGITIKPYLPKHWKKLTLHITNQKKWYKFDYNAKNKCLSVMLEKGAKKSEIIYKNKKYILKRKIPIKTRIYKSDYF